MYLLSSEFDNNYGTISMGIGVGKEFPDFDYYDDDQVCKRVNKFFLKITISYFNSIFFIFKKMNMNGSEIVHNDLPSLYW